MFSIRLDETTAAQVDQYGAFIRASADGVVDRALNYVFSKDREFQDCLKTPQASKLLLLCVYVKDQAMVRRVSLQKSLWPRWSPRLLCVR
jgi:hypothetical protein